MYKGKLIRLKVNGDYVPCEMSCEVQVNQETLQVTNNTNGRAKSFINGYYDWSVVLEGKLNVSDSKGASQALLETILNDTESVHLEILSNDPDGAPFMLVGEAITTGWSMSAGGSGQATNNTTFQGSGELKIDYELYWLIINSMPIEADYKQTVVW